MVHVTHRHGRQEVTIDSQTLGTQNSAAQNPVFLLTNNNGDFFSSGNPNPSNYCGLFCRQGDSYFKVLSNISLSSPTTGLLLDGVRAERFAGAASQRFLLVDDGLLAHSSGHTVLTLDCKRLYDESSVGRIYAVHCSDAVVSSPYSSVDGVKMFSIEYTKYSDDALSAPAYKIFVSVACMQIPVQHSMRNPMHDSMQNPILLRRWHDCGYTYDDRRGTKNTRWVYDLLEIDGPAMIGVAIGSSLDEASRKALSLLSDAEKIEHAADHSISASAPTLGFAQQLSYRALAALWRKSSTGAAAENGIMAGLPWFFQFWSRDELISSGGLLAAKEYDSVMKILDKWYGVVRDDGTLPALYPNQGLASSDAPGWLGKRTHDLLVALSDENLLSQVPRDVIDRWRDTSGRMIDACAGRLRDNLVWSGVNTTWMDTQHNDDGRSGARIEIQALYLALFDAHAYLCTITKQVVVHERSDFARRIIAAVHTRMVKDGLLLDGLHESGDHDLAVRPNIFIAWYVAPRLFTQSEWTRFFHQTLPKLWLSWGGLASIATDDKNYHPWYTGEDVASYHRGDSWYFVNNMAAMALYSVDPSSFSAPVKKLLDASMNDLLSQGFCGHASEISSAAVQEAAGCHAQAWSASTLLEALQRIPYSLHGLHGVQTR